MYSSSVESFTSLQFLQRARHVKLMTNANKRVQKDDGPVQVEMPSLKSEMAKHKKRFSEGDVDPLNGSISSPEKDPTSVADISAIQGGVRGSNDKLDMARAGRVKPETDDPKLIPALQTHHFEELIVARHNRLWNLDNSAAQIRE